MERYKNIRRGGRKRAHCSDGGSKAKAPCLEEDSGEDITEEDYDKAVTNLKAEFKRANPRIGVVQKLMDITRLRRRKWIDLEKPNSLQLIQEFPFLRTETIRSFIVGIMVSHFPDYMKLRVCQTVFYWLCVCV